MIESSHMITRQQTCKACYAPYDIDSAYRGGKWVTCPNCGKMIDYQSGLPYVPGVEKMIIQQKHAKNGSKLLMWIVGVACILLLVVFVDWNKTPISVSNNAKSAPREGRVTINKTCVGFESKEDLDKATSFNDLETYKAFTTSKIARGKAYLFHAGDQGHVVDSGWTGTRQIIPEGSSGSYWISEEWIRTDSSAKSGINEKEQKKYVPSRGFVEISKACYAFKNPEDYDAYWNSVDAGEWSAANKEAMGIMKKGKAVLLKSKDSVLVLEAAGDARQVAAPNPPGGTGGYSENAFWISTKCIKKQ